MDWGGIDPHRSSNTMTNEDRTKATIDTAIVHTRLSGPPSTVWQMNELHEAATVAASVDEVWADFTRASALAEWMWPPRFDTRVEVDLRAGGVWEVRSEVAELAVLATIVTVDAPRSLRLAWRWDGETHTTDVVISLIPVTDESTSVVVRHSGFAKPEERESHVEGWSNCLQRLVERHERSG